MAQWIRRLTSDQKIAGSSPARVVCFLTMLFIFLHVGMIDQVETEKCVCLFVINDERIYIMFPSMIL